MQVKINNGEEPQFQPIDLCITIESKRELELFIGMFNISGEVMVKYINKHIPSGIEKFSVQEVKDLDDSLYTVYNELDEQLIKHQ
jgi:hypothetical protein